MAKDNTLIRVLDPRGQPSGIFGHGLGAQPQPGGTMDPFIQPGGAVQKAQMAPRLFNLDNKTVYLVNTGFAGSQEFLEDTQKWFGINLPKTKTILIQKPGGMFSDAPDLWLEIKKNADAVVFGVGG